MNQKTKMRYTSQKGITLIALVITIIVLLILAGITISTVIGDDGIIAQAQKAKEKQNNAEQDEKDAIDIASGVIDSYIEGTAANLAKTEKLKVGDVVKYEYTGATYTTPAESTGKSVHSETQTFNSGTGKESEITLWRVLSTENGIIQLIGSSPYTIDNSTNLMVHKENSQLTITGRNGYINGPTVLNEMCKALYSGPYGTARSVNIDDINKALNGEAIQAEKNNRFFYENAGAVVRLNVEKTIAELEAETGLSGLATNDVIGANSIGDLKINAAHYGYGAFAVAKDAPVGKTLEEQVMFGGLGKPYLPRFWAATQRVLPEYNVNGTEGFVTYRISYVNPYAGDDMIADKSVWYSGTGNDAKYYDVRQHTNSVRPIVTLNTGIELEYTDEKLEFYDSTNAQGENIYPEFSVWEIKK